MKRIFFLFLIILLFAKASPAQTKVANFSIGKYGTKTYEHFSFCCENGRGTRIEYAYGVKPKDVKLTFLGSINFETKKCIKVQFPNSLILFISISESKIRVEDEYGKYLKLFRWKYEGPINGVGTFCDACAENESEAIKLIMKCYLN